MKENSESIYGTSASSFEKLTWGRSTQRKIYGGTRLYLHVFDWTEDGILSIPGITNKIKKAYLLSDTDKEIKFKRNGVDLTLSVPQTAPNKINSVIVLDIDGSPDIVYAPEIKSNQNVFIDTLHVTLSSNSYKSEIHFTLDGSTPDINSPIYEKPILLTETSFVKAAAFRDDTRVSPYTEKSFNRDYNADRKVNGLKYEYYEGNWENLPDFKNYNPIKVGRTFLVNLNTIPTKEEYFGVQLTGEISISESGDYTFYLSSNDGSNLYIDNKLVIDNDGLHGTIEKSGDIKLSVGRHKVRLHYFQAGGKAVLDLLLKGPNINKMPIPVSMLFPVEQ